MPLPRSWTHPRTFGYHWAKDLLGWPSGVSGSLGWLGWFPQLRDTCPCDPCVHQWLSYPEFPGCHSAKKPFSWSLCWNCYWPAVSLLAVLRVSQGALGGIGINHQGKMVTRWNRDLCSPSLVCINGYYTPNSPVAVVIDRRHRRLKSPCTVLFCECVGIVCSQYKSKQNMGMVLF